MKVSDKLRIISKDKIPDAFYKSKNNKDIEDYFTKYFGDRQKAKDYLAKDKYVSQFFHESD